MRLRTTNYYVEIFSEGVLPREGFKEPEAGPPLLERLLATKGDLKWVATTKLSQQPLTGLARKALQRLNLMAVPQVTIEL